VRFTLPLYVVNDYFARVRFRVSSRFDAPGVEELCLVGRQERRDDAACLRRDHAADPVASVSSTRRTLYRGLRELSGGQRFHLAARRKIDAEAVSIRATEVV
jgi:hypothetical protein